MSIKGFQIDGAVQKYDYTALDNKPTTDTTLSVSGGFADAAAVGNAIATIRNGGSGLSNEAKQALLALLEKVAYIDGNGQTYYDALETAFYPPVNLVSISAVYEQSGIVYDNQTLDSLRANLVVTARYDDTSTQNVTSYTLSGTLATGTSTITVAYGGKTTTFTVVVNHATTQYTITNNLTNCSNSNSATVTNENSAYSGTLTVDADYVMDTVAIMMGGTDVTSTAYDSETGAISIASVTGNVVITAEAVEDVGYISGEPYTFTITNGYVVDDTTHELVENSGMSYVELPCKGVDYLERYWSQFGGTCRMDFYDGNGNHLQTFKMQTGGTIGCTVDKSAETVIVSGTTGKMQNLIVTPYNYPDIGEETSWVANTIYAPEECASMVTGYMFAATASTISASIGYATSNFRGQYQFYDQNKTLLSSTNTAEIIGGTGIWRTPVEIPSGTYYIKIWANDVSGSGNASNNMRIVFDREVA